jgi:hypothetical protein
LDVLRTKNSGIKSFSIDIQVLTDCFLNRTQVGKYRRLAPIQNHAWFGFKPCMVCSENKRDLTSKQAWFEPKSGVLFSHTAFPGFWTASGSSSFIVYRSQ